MFRKIGFILSIGLILTGLIFLGLDILDIAEGREYNIPTALINTIFISLLAVPVLYFTTREYLVHHFPETMGLNFSVFAFGFSVLVYGWFTGISLNAHLASYDGGVLLASVFHIAGMIYGETRFSKLKTRPYLKLWPILLIYLLITGIIAIVTWLASLDIIVVTGTAIDGIGTRDILHGIAIVLILATAYIFLRTYLKHLKRPADFHYWYFWGLVLFASGVLFISISQLEGRVAWSGRVCQYISSIYFIIAASYSRQIHKKNQAQE